MCLHVLICLHFRSSSSSNHWYFTSWPTLPSPHIAPGLSCLPPGHTNGHPQLQNLIPTKFEMIRSCFWTAQGRSQYPSLAVHLVRTRRILNFSLQFNSLGFFLSPEHLSLRSVRSNFTHVQAIIAGVHLGVSVFVGPMDGLSAGISVTALLPTRCPVFLAGKMMMLMCHVAVYGQSGVRGLVVSEG